MKISRVGIVLLALFAVLSTTGCINKILARRSLVDGAQAYQDRKYVEAERLFRDAVAKDPEQKTAQLFLARTLHSEFAADRKRTDKAQEAIVEYEKVIPAFEKDLKVKAEAYAKDPNNEKTQREFLAAYDALSSTTSAIASLYDNTQQTDKWSEWQTKVANSEEYPAEVRANALSSLASKQYTCANEISDVDPVKKTVNKGGKAEFQFTKPAKQEDYDKLKGCIETGTKLIDQALAFQSDKTNALKGQDVKSMNDVQLKITDKMAAPFESVNSYKASLLIQSARLAEMDGRTADKDNFKKQADEAKAKFLELSEVRKNVKDEQEARAKAKEEAEAGAQKKEKK